MLYMTWESYFVVVILMRLFWLACFSVDLIQASSCSFQQLAIIFDFGYNQLGLLGKGAISYLIVEELVYAM